MLIEIIENIFCLMQSKNQEIYYESFLKEIPSDNKEIETTKNYNPHKNSPSKKNTQTSFHNRQEESLRTIIAIHLKEAGNLKGSTYKYSLNTKLSNPFETLLEDSTKILKLPSSAKAIFTQSGKRLKNIEDLKNEYYSLNEELNSTPFILFISTTNSFKSPTKREKIHKLVNESNQQTNDEKICNENTALLQSPNIHKDSLFEDDQCSTITVGSHKPSPYARYHQLVSILPGTVEDQIRDCLLGSYITLPYEYRQVLPDSPAYEERIKSTRLELFSQQLIDANIYAPSSSSKDFCFDKLIQRSASRLYSEKKISEIQFSILGPRGCGKTTTLYHYAMVLYHKLLNSDLSEDFMMMPLNFLTHAMYFNDPYRIYPVFVQTAMNSVHYARFELAPFILQLKEWFLLAPTIGRMPEVPIPKTGLPRIDPEKIKDLGLKIFKIFHSNKLVGFIQFLAIFPTLLAQSLGMTGAIYVIDHYDAIDNEIGSAFAREIFENDFSKEMPLLCSSLVDKELMKNLNRLQPIFCNDTVLVNEDKENYELPQKIVSISPLGLELTTDLMMGYPAYIGRFFRICKLVENQINQPQFQENQLKTKVMSGKTMILKMELHKLLNALIKAKVPGFNNDLLINLQCCPNLVCSIKS